MQITYILVKVGIKQRHNVTVTLYCRMSFPIDKDEDTRRSLMQSEWMRNMQALNVTRSDMNRIIMNYLVTGMFCFITVYQKFYFDRFNLDYYIRRALIDTLLVYMWMIVTVNYTLVS